MEKDFFYPLPENDLDRVDGRAKVTGTAKYSYEYPSPNMAYGVVVGSTIAKGTMTALDTKAAERAPGVLGVLSHLNIPKLPGYEVKEADAKKPETEKGYKVFADNKIRFNGQPIAFVMADTLERAVYAASLVKAQYSKQPHITDLHEQIKRRKPLEGNDDFKDYVRGEADAWNKAPVKLQAEYEIPLEVHNPMEMHAVTVVWEGDDKVTVYEKTQWLTETKNNIKKLFDLKDENVRVISKFLGGAFGSAFNTWPHSVAALIGSRMIKRPLKVSLSRDQMFMMVGYRPEAIQKIGIGATKDGKLVGITHEAYANTASYQVFTEGIVNISRTLYNSRNVNTRYKLYPLNLSLPTWMRGPGEVTGTFALESAIDELAYALKIDPLELRLLNYTETDPEHENRPHSSKFLKEAFEIGAEKIGWKERDPRPGTMKEGDWQVGYGVGTGVFIAWRGANKLNARLTADGSLIIQTGVTDMGPGTATAMTKLASDLLGIAPNKIKFEMGDSNLPPGILQGGSGTTSSVGTSVNNASVTIKKKIAELLKDNSLFHTENIHEVKMEDLVFKDGFVSLSTDPSKRISYSEVLRNAGLPQLDIVEDTKGGGSDKYSSYSYSAHFVKVKVHPLTGEVRVARVVSVVDAGKIVNAKTARSQIIGGVVGGIGMALTEEGIVDHRYGRWVNNDFAGYHVPVHADVPHIEAYFVDKPDPYLNPIGSKGMGEVSMIGFPPAVANAVYHATGKRIRKLPITPDKLI